VRLTVEACTLINSSPGFGVGSATSWTRTTSGGPYLVQTAAFMPFPPPVNQL